MSVGRPRPRSRPGIPGQPRALLGGTAGGSRCQQRPRGCPRCRGSLPAGPALPLGGGAQGPGAAAPPPPPPPPPRPPALKSGGGSGAAPAAALPARPGMGSAHSVPAEMRELADRTGCEYREPRAPPRITHPAPSPRPRRRGDTELRQGTPGSGRDTYPGRGHIPGQGGLCGTCHPRRGGGGGCRRCQSGRSGGPHRKCQKCHLGGRGAAGGDAGAGQGMRDVSWDPCRECHWGRAEVSPGLGESRM